MRVKNKVSWSKPNAPVVTIDMDGHGLVMRACHNDSRDGELEGMQSRLDTLCAIVGRLIDELPESRRLEIAGLQYDLERA